MTVHPYDGIWLDLRSQSDADRLLLRRLARALRDDPAVRLTVMLDLLGRHDAAPLPGGPTLPDADTDDHLPLTPESQS